MCGLIWGAAGKKHGMEEWGRASRAMSSVGDKKTESKGSLIPSTDTRARRARWDGGLEPQAPAAAPQRKVARLLSVFSVYWQLMYLRALASAAEGRKRHSFTPGHWHPRIAFPLTYRVTIPNGKTSSH